MTIAAATQLGTSFMVQFSGSAVPSTAGYVPRDGWKQTVLFAAKNQVEDIGGNVVNRTGAGKATRWQGTLYMPQGSVPSTIKPGDSLLLTAVDSGTGGTFCVESAPIIGNRGLVEMNISLIKEDSMTYS